MLAVHQDRRQICHRGPKLLPTPPPTSLPTPRGDRTVGKWWVWQMSWSDPTIFGAEITSDIFNWVCWESKLLPIWRSFFFLTKKKTPWLKSISACLWCISLALQRSSSSASCHRSEWKKCSFFILNCRTQKLLPVQVMWVLNQVKGADKTPLSKGD